MENYYGNLRIPSSEGGYAFSDFLISPSGRFVAARAYHPEDNQEYLGTGLKVWDVLSGDTHAFYPYEAFMNGDYWGLHEGYSYPRMTEYYWTEEDQLVMVVDVTNSGDRIESGFVVLDARVQEF